MKNPRIREQVTSLKLSGDTTIHVLHHPEYGDILVRPLSVRAFNALRDLITRGVITQTDAEDIVFKHCVLDEKLLALYPDHLLAGEVSFIANEIFAISAPSSAEELQGRVNYHIGMASNDVMSKLITVICAAFPSYTPTELEELTWKEIAKLAGWAQAVLLERGIMKEPIEIFDRRKQSKKKQAKHPGVLGSAVPPGLRRR